MVARKARSASTAWRAPMSSIGSSSPMVAPLPERHSTARAPCADLREHRVGPQGLHRFGRQRQPGQSGLGHHYGAPVRHPGEPGGDIPPEALEGQVGPQPGQLGPPALASRGHRRSGGEVRQPAADQCVAWVAADRHRRQAETRSGDGRKILGGVDSGIGSTVENRCLYLAHEHTLAAYFPNGHVRAAVSGGGDRDQFDRQTWVRRSQERGDVIGLPKGQRAPPGGQPEHRHMVLAQGSGLRALCSGF